MLGSGYPTLVAHWTRSFPFPTRHTSHSVLNSASRKAWRSDGPTQGICVWEMHDVWGWDKNKKEGVVLRENYFVKDPRTGRKVRIPSATPVLMGAYEHLKVDWYTNFYYPFLKRWADRARKAMTKDKMFFVEPIPNEACSTKMLLELITSNEL